MTASDPIALEILKNLYISAAEEMGLTLGRTAYSPNIKERRDFSCACFLADGRMIAQAAHIPVHLGAMPASVQAALGAFEAWSPGDIVLLNDPYLGGTHLPDITMVSPVFAPGAQTPTFFVASRAHHADVGGATPGSMGIATEIWQEGLIIPPVKLAEAGKTNRALLDLVLRNVRTPVERRGDLAAQMAAQRVGEQRLLDIVARYGIEEALEYAGELLAYSERLTRTALSRIPPGSYTFADEMDDDGLAHAGDEGVAPPSIRVTIRVGAGCMTVDYGGTSPAVPGPLNAVRAITESATWYVVRCIAQALLSESTGAAVDVPVNSGAFAPVQVIVPEGSLLDAGPPHAVAAGNVETSQRVVDVLLGALACALPEIVPAASQGTMNNLTIGGHDPERGTPFAYYETVGGGAGAGPLGDGLSGVQVHMTNTLNTPIEALEYAYPLRVRRYALRRGSGGEGSARGGDGLVRELECLVPSTVALLSERRRTVPYALGCGTPGAPGVNLLIRAGSATPLPGKVRVEVEAGAALCILTPGGGGWSEPGFARTGSGEPDAPPA
ncbi:MAG TPA: hydantoinase B/oxoprolinase family protein [Anaerolineae bacterium]|nr:hydantoinase B/oxoprolinase family protein [Anaerolineae bacterium]